MGIILTASIIFSGFYSSQYPSVLPFIFTFIAGMGLHSFLDLFYLDGVALLWPLTSMTERTPPLLGFTFEELNPIYNDLIAKVIATLDGGFESIYFLSMVFFANKFGTDTVLSYQIGSRRLQISAWPKKLQKIAIGLICVTVFFLILALLSIGWPAFDRDTFIVFLYIPLSFVYLLTGLLPFLMRETVKELNF
jgi:hypothetical protein